MERSLRPDVEAEIAGFFQRIFAAIIDVFVLGAIFIFGVLPFFGWFAPEAAYVQLGIDLLYFSLLNSRIAGGATLGKRLLGIRVVTRTGDYIGFLRALWRAAVDILPLALGSLVPLWLPAPHGDSLIRAIVAAGVIGLPLATIYLYIFNWNTRQVVHDLAAGTFVVKAERADRPFHGRTLLSHVVIAAVLILLVGAVAARLEPKLSNPTGCAAKINGAVRTLPFVDRVTVKDEVSSWRNGSSSARRMSVIVTVTRKEYSPEARSVAAKALSACPIMKPNDVLNIMIIDKPKGYRVFPRLGRYPGTVEEWRGSLDFESRHKGRKGTP